MIFGWILLSRTDFHSLRQNPQIAIKSVLVKYEQVSNVIWTCLELYIFKPVWYFRQVIL